MLSDFFDSQNFIGHKDDKGNLVDFGDSCARTFSYAICTDPDLIDLLKKLTLITVDNGYRRHWDKTMWTGKSGISRDQFKPLMWALSLKYNMFPSMCVKQNNYFTWNDYPIWPTSESKKKRPDFVLPTIVWGSDIRAQRSKRFGQYTILNICDVVDLIGTLILVVKSWFKPNETSSDLNQLNEIIFKNKTVETPISVLTRYVYKWFRRTPDCGGGDFSKFHAVLHTYYNNPVRHPPMWECYDLWIDKLL
jgi:hypothetical protein